MSVLVKYGLGGYNPELPNDNVIEQIVDNGDGTATRTVYSDNDEVVVETINDFIFEQNESIPVEAVVVLASQLILKAGDLWNALIAIENENSARQAIEIVTDAALTAALHEA